MKASGRGDFHLRRSVLDEAWLGETALCRLRLERGLCAGEASNWTRWRRFLRLAAKIENAAVCGDSPDFHTPI